MNLRRTAHTLSPARLVAGAACDASENVQRLVNNIRIWCHKHSYKTTNQSGHKHGCKCLDNIWFYWRKPAGKWPNVRFKIVCCLITAWKCLDVTFKISGIVATKLGWKTSKHHVTNIWFYICKHGWKMSRGFIESTWFCCHNHGWEMSWRHIKNIQFYWSKPAGKCPNVPFKISGFITTNLFGKYRDTASKISCLNLQTWLENIVMPHQKYLVLYKQTWLESVQRFYWKYLVLMPHHDSKMSRRNIKNIWICCNKTRLENVRMPHQKYLVLYKQTWLESVQRFYWKDLVLLSQSRRQNVSTSHWKYWFFYCHKPAG